MKVGIQRYGLFCSLLLGTLPALLLHSEPSDLPVEFMFYEDETLGERLIVSPKVRADHPAGSLELRITDQAYYNLKEHDFAIREIATVSGQGLGNEGLIFYVENDESRENFIQLLDVFVEQSRNFRQHRSEISGKTEPWMGRGDSALSGSRPIGEIQMDFIRKPSTVTLNWDLGQNRLWLSIDGLINIDSRYSAELLDMISRIPEYSAKRQELSESMKQKNEKINAILNLPQSASAD